jgi:hypothetical protein
VEEKERGRRNDHPASPSSTSSVAHNRSRGPFRSYVAVRQAPEEPVHTHTIGAVAHKRTRARALIYIPSALVLPWRCRAHIIKAVAASAASAICERKLEVPGLGQDVLLTFRRPSNRHPRIVGFLFRERARGDEGPRRSGTARKVGPGRRGRVGGMGGATKEEAR